MINILQLKLISLREKEIYNRHPARTENGEDDKCPPADILHCDRGDLYDDEDAHPIYERAKCLALWSDTGCCYLCGVEPWDGEPADSEEDLEDKDHCCGAVRGWAGADGKENAGQGEAKAQSRCGEHKECAPAEPVHCLSYELEKLGICYTGGIRTHKGIIEPIRYVIDVQPPRMRLRTRETPMVFS